MTHSNIPSAFPDLPEDPDLLPEIPGGWHDVEIALDGKSVRMYRPRDPDLFLDDAQVHQENARHDYMPYWAYLWPSSIPMSNAVLRAPWPVGAEVLELGAGIGLVGLAAAGRGDRVTFSDYDRTALHVCRLNTRLNGLSDPELWQLDWRSRTQRTFPVLIGCEVTYDATLHEPLLDTIAALLAPDGLCWLGDPGRYQSEFFYQKAQARGFQLRLLDQHQQPVDGIRNGEFHLLELKHPSTGSVT